MAPLVDVFNHLVLPPKVPGAQDKNIEAIGEDVVGRLIQATSTLSKLSDHEQSSSWKAIRDSLRRFRSLHERGRLEKPSLLLEFSNLRPGQPLLLHVAEQNAALIVRYNDKYAFDKGQQYKTSAETYPDI
jgi:hypothetical protein